MRMIVYGLGLAVLLASAAGCEERSATDVVGAGEVARIGHGSDGPRAAGGGNEAVDRETVNREAGDRATAVDSGTDGPPGDISSDSPDSSSAADAARAASEASNASGDRTMRGAVSGASNAGASNTAARGSAPADANRTGPASGEAAPAPRRPARGVDGYLDLTFDDLKFDIEKGEPFERSMLTESIEQMAGKPIRIRGYILPSFRQSGIEQFVLVRDNLECCFGPGAALYDCVVVAMQGGRTIDYTVRPVAVEGTFSIRELLGPEGEHLAVFYLEGTSVR